VLLIDYRVGLSSLLRDCGSDEFKNNMLALAHTARLYKLPTVL